MKIVDFLISLSLSPFLLFLDVEGLFSSYNTGHCEKTYQCHHSKQLKWMIEDIKKTKKKNKSQFKCLNK